MGRAAGLVTGLAAGDVAELAAGLDAGFAMGLAVGFAVHIAAGLAVVTTVARPAADGNPVAYRDMPRNTVGTAAGTATKKYNTVHP